MSVSALPATIDARINAIQQQMRLLGLRPPGAGAGTATGTAFATALADAGATTGATPVATGTDSGSGTAAGQAIVASAKKYLGVPYVWGGTDPAKGLDCSGLVQRAYKDLGYDLPRVSYQQAEAGRPVASMAQAQPGDILAFGSPVNHVGIYVGDGKMIEAPRPGKDVRIADVPSTPTAIRRIVPDAPTAAAGTGASTASAAVSGRTGSGVPASTPYADLFRSAAARHGVDASLLAAIAKQESGFRPDAVSPAGAQGLMQLMPATARGLGVTNAFDPTQAVDGAAKLMSQLLDRFGRTDLALAAYNAGPGAVLRYDGIPPYAETQAYVRKVLDHQRTMAGGAA